MSYSVDVNLLIYASDQSSPFHARAAGFLTECASGSEPLHLAWSTLMGYLRIATNPRVLKSPLSLSEASANIEALLSLPHVRLLSERMDFFQVFQMATRGLNIRGKLVPDAHLAALLLQNGVTVLYSNDSDFSLFPFLEVRNPLVSGAS